MEEGEFLAENPQYTLPTAGAADAPLVCIEINQQWANLLLSLIAVIEADAYWVEGTDMVLKNFMVQDATIQIWGYGDCGSGEIMPVGTIIAYAGNTIPDGWHLCDGASLSRADYPDLFAAIGTIWGSSDALTFKVPDLTDRFPRGANLFSGHAVGNYHGEEQVTLSQAQMPVHDHDEYTWTGNTTNGSWAVDSIQNRIGQFLTNTKTGTRGGGQAHNNVPPAAAVNYIINTGIV